MIARRLGQGLGWLFSFFAPGRMALVERHLQRVTGLEIGLKPRARRMFASYGRYWAEVFWMRTRRKESVVTHTEIVNVEALHQARDAGRGLIVALPHMGNWEAAGARAEKEGIRVLAAAEALDNTRLLQWFTRARESMGMDVVIAGTGLRTTGALIKQLRSGGTVALLADRHITGEGVEVDFFGERTTMSTGPVALADRTGAILFPVGCYFKSGRGHRFVVHSRIEIPDVENRQQRIAVGTQLLACALETIIREAPEQWHLFQPNWPTDRVSVEGEV